MISVKDSVFKDQILKEFNYDFGDVFVFEGFIISEINEGVSVSWDDHMVRLVNDVAQFTGSNGEDFVYISNRIHSYSVVPSDWLKFFKNSYALKGYGVVGHSPGSFINIIIENLFFNKKIRRFSTLEDAIQWSRNEVLSEANS